MGEAVRRAQGVVTARREAGWNPIAAMQHLMDPRRAMDPATWFGGAWPPQQPGAQTEPPPDPEHPGAATAPPVDADLKPPDIAASETRPAEEPQEREAADAEPALNEPAMSAEAAMVEQLAAMRAQLDALEKKVAAGEASD
jgi:hypothetical protein